MPRIARIKVRGEETVYHVMSRTALDGFVMGDVEKDYLLKLMKRLSGLYFAETLGFCLMGSHFLCGAPHKKCDPIRQNPIVSAK